jgi:hypothetical protein
MLDRRRHTYAEGIGITVMSGPLRVVPCRRHSWAQLDLRSGDYLVSADVLFRICECSIGPRPLLVGANPAEARFSVTAALSPRGV